MYGESKEFNSFCASVDGIGTNSGSGFIDCTGDAFGDGMIYGFTVVEACGFASGGGYQFGYGYGAGWASGRGTESGKGDG